MNQRLSPLKYAQIVDHIHFKESKYNTRKRKGKKKNLQAADSMSGVSGSSRLLKINLVDFNLAINELVNIHHHTQAINVHEDKAWVHIIGNVAVGTGGRPWVYNNTSLVFVSCELMGMTGHKYVHIQLPLEHC